MYQARNVDHACPKADGYRRAGHSTPQPVRSFLVFSSSGNGNLRATKSLEGRRMNLLVNLRLALRRLIKQPGFTVTTILTLTLAIGANTAIFSVIDAVLMHPSGVDAPQR